MLRITVELVPFGDESRSKQIGKGYIVNDGTGDSKTGNYDCTFYELDNDRKREVKIKNFDRSKGFWSLIRGE